MIELTKGSVLIVCCYGNDLAQRPASAIAYNAKRPGEHLVQIIMSRPVTVRAMGNGLINQNPSLTIANNAGGNNRRVLADTCSAIQSDGD